MPSIKISGSSSGANVIFAFAGLTGQIIRVHSYVIVATTAVSFTFEDSDGTDATGAMPLGANGGVAALWNPEGHFSLAANKGLSFNLSSGVLVAGHVTYSYHGAAA